MFFIPGNSGTGSRISRNPGCPEMDSLVAMRARHPSTQPHPATSVATHATADSAPLQPVWLTFKSLLQPIENFVSQDKEKI